MRMARVVMNREQFLADNIRDLRKVQKGDVTIFHNEPESIIVMWPPEVDPEYGIELFTGGVGLSFETFAEADAAWARLVAAGNPRAYANAIHKRQNPECGCRCCTG